MQTLKKHKVKIYMIIIILLFQVVLPLLTAMVENSYALTGEYDNDVVELEEELQKLRRNTTDNN